MDLRIIAPGAIGMGTTPGRVLPSRSVRKKITTIQKLKVIQIDLEENILVIKGFSRKPGNLLSIVPSE
jgi:ribosomal protein L3